VATGGVATGEIDEPSVPASLAQVSTYSLNDVPFEVPEAYNLSWAYHQTMPCRTSRRTLERERIQG
jgi:hypothetical protein